MKIVSKRPASQTRSSVLVLLASAGALVIVLLLARGRGPETVQDAWRELSEWGALQVSILNPEGIPPDGPTSVSGVADLPTIVLDLPFENVNRILDQRQDGLERGIVLADEADFVTADLTISAAPGLETSATGGRQAQGVGEPTGEASGQAIGDASIASVLGGGDQAIPVRIRLQPGVVRHLEDDDLWNYEIVSRANQEGRRFSYYLLDPADNNGAAEWVFMEALRREGYPVPDYQFVRVIINGVSRGVYALQEVVGPLWWNEEEERFDVVAGYEAGPLWYQVAAYGGDAAAAMADPVTSFGESSDRFAAIEASDSVRFPDIEESTAEELSLQLDRAAALLRGLQRKDEDLTDILDATRYGRFLALIDLVGAPSALSPLNIRYLYDAEGDRLAPVAANGNPLAGPDRVSAEAMYHDPLIQTAYLRAIAEFSDPAYLADLRAGLEAQLRIRQRYLANGASGGLTTSEIWEALAVRQDLLARSLRPVRPVLAYLGAAPIGELAADSMDPGVPASGFLRIEVANTLNLPVEVLGFDLDGTTFVEVSQARVSTEQESALWRPQDLSADEDGRFAPSTPSTGSPQGGFAEGQAPARVWLAPANDSAGSGPAFISFDLPLAEIVSQDQELQFLGEFDIHVATRLPGSAEAQLTAVSRGSP
jgi:hypothetical protein